MAGLSVSGIGSGLDVDGIIGQLMELERRPLQKIDKQISGYRSQLSAYGQLKSAVSTFESAMEGLSSIRKFQVFSAVSGNEDLLTATTNEFAAVGDYRISVENLAQQHKVGSALTGIGSSTIIGGAAGDQLALTVGTDTMTIDLAAGKTIAQIKDQINSDSNNPGIKATVVNGSNGDQRLVLTALESGQENAISFTETFDAASTGLGMGHINIADGSAAELEKLDAKVVVDGMTVLRPTNSIDDIIQGVTLDLKDDSQAGVEFTLEVGRDDDAIVESVQGFASAYNDVMKKLKDLHKEGGDLEADNTIISIQNQIRSRLNSVVETGGAFGYLAELGLSTNVNNGQLEVDDDDLRSALNEDFEGVAKIFAKEDEGVAFLLKNLADQFTTYDGLLDSRKDGIQERIDVLEERKIDMEYRLDLIQDRYKRQYGGLDSLLAGMQSTGNYLAAQLATLPGF